MLFVLSALPISRQDLFMTFTFLSVYFPYHKHFIRLNYLFVAMAVY